MQHQRLHTKTISDTDITEFASISHWDSLASAISFALAI